MQFHALNSKKTSKCHENQNHLHSCQIMSILNSINVNFLQFLCTTIWNVAYQFYAKVQKDFLEVLIKNWQNIKKFQIMTQKNQVLDMTNLEINSLSNHIYFF